MVKNHLKALYAPKTWNIKRKETTFVTKPNAGAHKFAMGISLNHILKNEIKVCNTSKETRYLLTNKECLVNGKIVTDYHYIVGFLDVITLPKIKKNYRVVFSDEGYISVIETDERDARHKICQIANKTIVKGGKTQINTTDARNMISDNADYKTSDSIVIELPTQKIVKHLKLENGASIMLIGGKNIGQTGKLDKVDGDKIVFTTKDNQTYETLKDFVFVIGKDKPEVKVRN